MTEKKCINCGVVKDISEYYAHKKMADGHLNKCKVCQRENSKAARERRPDYYREMDRLKSARPKYVAMRNEYRKTEAGRSAREKAAKNYEERYPLKRAAHIITCNAIRDGRLVRPSVCSCCGANSQPEAHHDDYTKPMDVRWLCSPCHYAWHRKNKAFYGNE